MMRDLEGVILSGRETRTLDYKAASAWNEGDKKACCELVKDILAFANSGGGFIVVGVAEVDHGFRHDGLVAEQLASFDTSRLNRFVQNYSDPPINCTIAKVPVDGRHYVVIQIPAFPDTPHICQKEFPGTLTAPTLYVRTDNNESAPIKSSADFRGIIELGVRHRQDRLLESVRAILVGANAQGPGASDRELFMQELGAARERGTAATAYANADGTPKYKGYREAWAFPASYSDKRLALGALRTAAERASVDYRGWPFLIYAPNNAAAPRATETGLEASIQWQDFLDQDRADYWYVGLSGLFLQRALMSEEGFALQNNSGPVIAIKELAAYVAEAMKCVCALYADTFNPDEEVTIGICVRGAAGRRVVNIGPHAMPLFDSYVSGVDVISYETTRTLADWQAGLVAHALEAWSYILERFNWASPNLVLGSQTMEKLLARRFDG